MSTSDASGTQPEQQTPPMAEAGCEDKIDRNVQGTVASTGFAELRSRAMRMQKDAYFSSARKREEGSERFEWYWAGKSQAFKAMLQWLDELEADAKDAST